MNILTSTLEHVRKNAKSPFLFWYGMPAFAVFLYLFYGELAKPENNLSLAHGFLFLVGTWTYAGNFFGKRAPWRSLEVMRGWVGLPFWLFLLLAIFFGIGLLAIPGLVANIGWLRKEAPIRPLRNFGWLEHYPVVGILGALLVGFLIMLDGSDKFPTWWFGMAWLTTGLDLQIYAKRVTDTKWMLASFAAHLVVMYLFLVVLFSTSGEQAPTLVALALTTGALTGIAWRIWWVRNRANPQKVGGEL